MAVKPDTSFVVGETCIYDENDPILEYVAKCGIVARNIVGDTLMLKLQVVEAITPSRLFPEFNNPGFVFSAVKDKNIKYFSGLWFLRETE